MAWKTRRSKKEIAAFRGKFEELVRCDYAHVDIADIQAQVSEVMLDWILEQGENCAVINPFSAAEAADRTELSQADRYRLANAVKPDNFALTDLRTEKAKSAAAGGK